MKIFAEFDSIEEAEMFAKTYDGMVVRCRDGHREFYRVYYYED